MQTGDRAQVEISAGILARLSVIAMSALPYETGGLLIGWRDSDRVVVSGWLELPTTISRTSRFEIDPGMANEALKRYLKGASIALEGYVGTWHTHPTLVPPSLVDLNTFRTSAGAAQAPLAFVVLATDGDASTAYVTWASHKDGEVAVEAEPLISVKGASRA